MGPMVTVSFACNNNERGIFWLKKSHTGLWLMSELINMENSTG